MVLDRTQSDDELEMSLESLVNYADAIGVIASNSRSVATESFDIGKVKDTVIRVFKSFWERITGFYHNFVAWIKSKFGFGDMKSNLAAVKKDINVAADGDVRAAEKDRVFTDSHGNQVTVAGFITEINAIVTSNLSKSAEQVIDALQTYHDKTPDDQKGIVNKIIAYYRKFFICYGSGDDLLDTEAIAEMAKAIDSDVNNLRKAFFDFVKFPAGASVVELTRKIDTFRSLPMFSKILTTLKVKTDKDEDPLSALHTALPEVSKIQETDFTNIKKTKKSPELDESLIHFLAERSNDTLKGLGVTVSAYEEICNVVDEQAKEFSQLKPGVIMPGSTLEEVRPYIDTATQFSKVQSALTKLMLHQYTAEMALVNATVTLRDTLNNFVIKKNEIVISYNSVSIADYVPPKLIQKYKTPTDPNQDPEERLISARNAWLMEYVSSTKKPIDVIDALKAAKWLNHHNPGLIVPYNHQQNGWTKPIETDPLKWRKDYVSECELYMGMNFSKERIENVLAARKYFYDKSQQG